MAKIEPGELQLIDRGVGVPANIAKRVRAMDHTQGIAHQPGVGAHKDEAQPEDDEDAQEGGIRASVSFARRAATAAAAGHIGHSVEATQQRHVLAFTNCRKQ